MKLKKKKTIACDVDLTVVDNIFSKGIGWLDWLKFRCISFNEDQFKKDLKEGTVFYTISKYFVMPDHIDPFNFWRQPDLYDAFKPYLHAVSILEEFSEDFNIIFATYSKSGHFSSKGKFLEREFPFMGSMNSTKNKGYIKCDYFIDDRNENINEQDSDVTCIRLQTPFEQDYPLTRDCVLVNNWQGIKDFIKDKESEFIG